MNSKTKSSGRTTRPWEHSEYLFVAGLPIVYTIDSENEEIVARMPGGGRATVSMLRGRGLAVKLPGAVRVNSYD